MVDQSGPVEVVVAQIVAQCRREIAAAGVHIEGAREILQRSRWMLAQWAAEQLQAPKPSETACLDSSARSEAARLGMFVGVAPETRRHYLRGSRVMPSISPRAASHTLRRSASG
jgi:hypothetical protein